MTLINKLKEDIRTATKNRDGLKSDILKLILGECQTRNDESDKFILSYMKKVIANNEETIKYKGGDAKLAQENSILNVYLPPKLSSSELENLIVTMLNSGKITKDKKSISTVSKRCKELGFEADSSDIMKGLGL